MINKYRKLNLFVVILLLSLPILANAEVSFRIPDGRLLKVGMSRIEVISMLGEPLSKDIETHGISTEPAYEGKKTETWSYILEGSIGGTYLVNLTLEGGIVVAIYAKQQGRM